MADVDLNFLAKQIERITGSMLQEMRAVDVVPPGHSSPCLWVMGKRFGSLHAKAKLCRFHRCKSRVYKGPRNLNIKIKAL
jgi:hypothetical protein